MTAAQQPSRSTASFSRPADTMARNIALTIAYDGTRYAGWQVQPDRPSIQATIEAAIESLSGERVSLLTAGRTDAGVHALGQVANFHTDATIPPEKWRDALRTRLPPDIVIRQSREVPEAFHATYAAKHKRYRYVILEAPVDDPFLRPYCWRLLPHLDVELMQACADLLVGTHDFRSFESHWPNKSDSVRTIYEARLVRTTGWNVWGEAPVGTAASPGEEGFVVFEIVGNGFLYNMVRAIVGTLVDVGRGRWTADEFNTAFRSQDRQNAGETAPAKGLFLVSVTY